MIKLDVKKLDVWNAEEFGREFVNICSSRVKESGVYKIGIGSRNDIEDFAKCEITDGFIEAYSENCIKAELAEVAEDEYVCCGFENGLCIEKNMYVETWFEESSTCYVRVEQQRRKKSFKSARKSTFFIDFGLKV